MILYCLLFTTYRHNLVQCVSVHLLWFVVVVFQAVILAPCCYTRHDDICLHVPHLFHIGFDRAHVEFGALAILSVKSGGLLVRVATVDSNPIFCGSEMPIDSVYIITI